MRNWPEWLLIFILIAVAIGYLMLATIVKQVDGQETRLDRLEFLFINENPRETQWQR